MGFPVADLGISLANGWTSVNLHIHALGRRIRSQSQEVATLRVHDYTSSCQRHSSLSGSCAMRYTCQYSLGL